MFISCNSSNCNLDYYETISGIKFPEGIEVIQCVDNMEFMTVAALSASKIDIQKIIEQNSFNKLPFDFEIQFSGNIYLDSINQVYNSNKNLYVKTGRTETNSWNYLIDSNTGMIWAEIQYPDWGGTNP